MYPLNGYGDRTFWLRRIEQCATAHNQAIALAKNWPGSGPIPHQLLSGVLGYGSQLDHAIMSAMEHGAQIEEIVTVSGLHPMYIEDLERYGCL